MASFDASRDPDRNEGEREPMKPEEISRLLGLLSDALSNEREQHCFGPVEEDGNSNLVSKTIRPPGEARHFTTPEGEFEFEWKDKFARLERGETPPFKGGEIVIVPAVVEHSDGAYVLRADANRKTADYFHLDPSQDAAALAAHIGLPLDVCVKVKAERPQDERYAGTWHYDAEILGVTKVPRRNPSQREIERLPTAERVVLSGTFYGFGGKHPDEWLPMFETALIGFDNGELARIDLPRGRVKFTGGALDNLQNKEPSFGDKVVLGAYVSRAKRRPDVDSSGFDDGTRLAMLSDDPCLLERPSAARWKEYLRQSEVRNAFLDRIQLHVSEGNFRGARRLIGSLRAQEMTGSELDHLEGILAQIPRPERPCQVGRDKYVGTEAPTRLIRKLDGAFESRLEGLSEAEFVAFAREALTGLRNPIQENSYASDLLPAGSELGVSQRSLERLAVECIERRLPSVLNRDYDHEAHWQHVANIQEALRFLARSGTETGAQRVFDYLYRFIEEPEALESFDDQDARRENMIFTCALVLGCSLAKVPPQVLGANASELEGALMRLAEVEREEAAFKEIAYISSEARKLNPREAHEEGEDSPF